ncbi:MAG: hypothetical protein JWR80_10149, partial [Bradyrhizobium sp.]|nr:hypothetical protein [Bradyrhizobium sp.]
GAQTVLPSDVNAQACKVGAAEFSGWFKERPGEKDAPVRPANSENFQPDSFCTFYKWSEQMFLWLTSPLAPQRYTFNARDFFAVDAPGSGGDRKLIPQDDPKPQTGFGPSIALVTDDLPKVVTDSEGKTRRVVRLQLPANASSPFVDRADKPVDVRSIASIKGKPLLLDNFNNVIDFKKTARGAPALSGPSAPSIRLADKTVLVGGVQRLLTVAGEVVEFGAEPGQAGGGDVLMTKDGAIVYYLLQVNDVFAYFKTGTVNTAWPTPTEFPTQKPTVDMVQDFANGAKTPADFKRTFNNGATLALELKSSWIDADTLPAEKRKDYLTITGKIPQYDKVSPTNWKQLPTSKDATLALVGFHVVGTTLGHPEMIWATFEHINNAPNAAYVYQTGPTTTKAQQADGPGNWLFHNNSQPSDENISSANAIGTIIIATPNHKIGPVNVRRMNPWGTPSAATSAPANNADLISINNSVRTQLNFNDVRKNYILIGATWTRKGLPPMPDVEHPNEPNNQIGTPLLANATMETFQQTRNCFGCHKNNMLGSGTGGLSHIWGKILPLFPKQP